MREGGVPPKNMAQSDAKHILVLGFLRSDDFLGVMGGGGGGGGGGGVYEKVNRQPTKPTDTMVTR